LSQQVQSFISRSGFFSPEPEQKQSKNKVDFLLQNRTSKYTVTRQVEYPVDLSVSLASLMVKPKFLKRSRLLGPLVGPLLGTPFLQHYFTITNKEMLKTLLTIDTFRNRKEHGRND